MTKTTGDMSQAAVDLNTGVLLRFLVFMTIIMGIKAVISAGSAYFTNRYHGQTGYRFRDNFAKHFLGLPYSDFKKKNSGEVLSVYSNDVPASVEFVTKGTLGMIGEIITVLASVVFMITISPLYTLIFYVMFPVLIVMQSVISAPIQKLAIKMSEETANFNSVVNDSLQNTSTVVAYSLEDIMETRYLAAYDKYFAAFRKYLFTLLKLLISGIVATLAPFLVIASITAVSVINGGLSLAEFIAFTSIAGTAASWLTMLSQRLRDIKVSEAGAVRLNDNTEGSLEDVEAGKALLRESTGTVELRNISFSYGEGGEPVLDGVSIKIGRGERVAIVGGSGSGKSTILKLLLGLYEPQSGSLFISGQESKGISKNSLREHFAYVPQDSFLLPVSIRENIAGTKAENADMDKIIDSCRKAGVLGFIESLPDKFDTILSESAENVSGGQKQRIAIARALYRDAPILLFDEATSSLDPVIESEVLESVKAFMDGRTVIMVAHRRKAIAACDRIIVLENGKVSGTGSHEELLDTNRIYASLYASLEDPRVIGGTEVS